MARTLSFDEMEKIGSTGKRIPFFGLEDNGDKAVVRFYHINGDDIEKLAVHRVKVGDEGRTVAVACLREPGQSESECPLCEVGNNVSARMYLKVLVYEKDKEGYYTKKPELKIWERGKGFGKQIQSLINRYSGNGKALMDTIFEIERDGKKGDQKTQYHIYKVDDLESDECPLPAEDDFDDIEVLGNLVQDRDFDEMNYYLDNEEFPPREQKSESTQSNEVVRRRESRDTSENDSTPVQRRHRNTEEQAEQPATARPRRRSRF